MNFQPSTLSGSPEFAFREQLFTPWMDAEHLQLHTDHMAALGMLALYSEYEPDHGFREIYWTPEVETSFEVRSARSESEFREIAERNEAESRVLSSLHISTDHRFSSVWLSSAGMEAATKVLDSLGIAPAQAEP